MFIVAMVPLVAQMTAQFKVQPDFDKVPFERLIDQIYSLRNTDLTKAIEMGQAMVEHFHEQKNWENTARSWEVTASLYWTSGNLAQGIECHRRARENFFKSDNKSKAGYSLSNIGLYKFYLGQRDSAMIYYLKSIEELKDNGRPHELALANYNLGSYFSELKNYPRAGYYHEQATKIAAMSKDTGVLINTLYSLGKLHVELQDLSKAYVYMRQAAMHADALKRYTLVGMINADLCDVALKLKRIESALHYGRKAMQSSLMVKDIPTYMEASVNLSNVYEFTGDNAARIRLLKEALEKEKESDHVWFSSSIYRWLAKASYKLGDYKRAYELQAAREVVDDSAKLISSSRLNTELEAKFQSAQKEKELSLKQLELTQKDLEIQKNRIAMYIVVAGLLVALLVASILFLQSRNKKLAHEREIRHVQQQKELQLMQALMNGEERERGRIAKDLHDGVAGMLAAVKMHLSTIPVEIEPVTHNEGFKRGLKLLDEAAREIRKTSHNLMPEVLVQHGLDEAIARYCSNISNANSIMIEYDSLGGISRFVESFELSVYRIVQELLNNILKHSRANHAVVQISEQNDILSIAIEDNGVGFQLGSTENDGMGLKSLRSRIRAINGKMELHSEEGNGVTAYLEFEVTTLKKDRNQVYEQDQARNN